MHQTPVTFKFNGTGMIQLSRTVLLQASTIS